MKKLLIVDDNDALRRILTFTLSSRPLALLEAENGFRALEVAGQETPDIVLLDIMMPSMDGYEVCRQMRKLPSMDDAVIIMISALGQRKDIDQGYASGADYYFVKPFLPTDLLKLIDELLTPADDGDESTLQ